jgi:hypothetical protein
MKVRVGAVYTYLIVLREEGPRGGHLVCRCRCGTVGLFMRAHVLSGNTRSCGCLKVEEARKRFTIHGEVKRTNGRRIASAEYRAWQAMRNRCLNSSAKDYRYYGGRGIGIDPSWNTFEKFLVDMGRRPSENHTLDRKDGDKDYTLNNCRWATRQEQAQNRKYCFLSLDIAKQIRAMYATGKYRQIDVGHAFGIDQASVSQIVRNVRWKCES